MPLQSQNSTAKVGLNVADQRPPQRCISLQDQAGARPRAAHMRNRFDRVIKFIPVLAAMVVAAATLPSWAQTYPSRPVQLVVGYAQGGTGDFIAHVLAARLTSALAQPVNVENRPGASGTAAAQSVARAAPDGYTLLVGQPGEVSINPLLAKDIGYDPEKDLQPVALAATSPLALVFQSSAPYPAFPR